MTGSLNIEFTIHVWQEGNRFIAHAMPLDVMSSGNTPDGAKKALDEAVHLFIQTASEWGLLTRSSMSAGMNVMKVLASHRRGSR